MGASHPSRGERLGLTPEGLPRWYLPAGRKTKYDFPRAKDGRRSRVEFNVGEREAGKPRRLDKYLMERFTGYSRSFLQQLIKDQQVLLNGQPTRASAHITVGDGIAVLLPPGTRYEPEEIPFGIVHEDDWLLALNKPPGLIVHPARGHKTGTLYHGLLHYFRARREADPSFRIGTVHRLDEETSGVMVYALEQAAHGELTRQFENRLVRKTYLCLVHGAPDFEAREVDAPLGVDPACRVRVAVHGLDARAAQTGFECLARAPDGRFALLRARPHTGRSHQIRVHARELGHAIVGDERYGGRKDDPAFGDLRPRVCLHAESLALIHPHHGYPMTLRAPLPADFAQLLARLGIAWREP